MKSKFIWLVMVTILSALFFSGTVFAEGEILPALPETPETMVEVTVSPAAPAPKASVDVQRAAETPVEGAQLEEMPTMEAPAIEADVPFEEASAIVAEETILESQSTDAPIVQLVDTEGEFLDLASQESADLLAGGDPYWQVSGVYYSSVVNPALCYPGTTIGDNLLYQFNTNPKCHRPHCR